MKRSQRILQLKKLVDQEAEREAIKLAQMQTQLTSEKEKIAQLMDFKKDYLLRTVSVGAQVRPGQLQDLEKFTKQLDFSISRQNRYIELLAQHVGVQRTAWIKLNNKVKAYSQWIEKLCAEEELIEGRNEQKLLDAFVINQWHKK